MIHQCRVLVFATDLNVLLGSWGALAGPTGCIGGGMQAQTAWGYSCARSLSCKVTACNSLLFYFFYFIAARAHKKFTLLFTQLDAPM